MQNALDGGELNSLVLGDVLGDHHDDPCHTEAYHHTDRHHDVLEGTKRKGLLFFDHGASVASDAEIGSR